MRLGSQPPLVSLPSSSLSSVLQGRETDMFSCVITQGISRSPWCSASLPCTLPSTITEGSLCELSPWAILPNNTKNHQSFETAIFLAQAPDHTSGLRSLLHSGKERKRKAILSLSLQMPGSWSSGILFSWDTCVTLNPHSNVLRHVLSSSFHRWGSLSWENWNDLPRVPKLVSNRVTIRMQCLDCCSLQIAGGHHAVRKPRQPHEQQHQETRHVSEAFEVFPAHVRY